MEAVAEDMCTLVVIAAIATASLEDMTVTASDTAATDQAVGSGAVAVDMIAILA